MNCRLTFFQKPCWAESSICIMFTQPCSPQVGGCARFPCTAHGEVHFCDVLPFDVSTLISPHITQYFSHCWNVCFYSKCRKSFNIYKPTSVYCEIQRHGGCKVVNPNTSSLADTLTEKPGGFVRWWLLSVYHTLLLPSFLLLKCLQ